MIKIILSTTILTLALSLSAIVYAAGQAVQDVDETYFWTEQEISAEYLRLLKNRNDAMRELNELLKLRNLHAEGKLFSS